MKRESSIPCQNVCLVFPTTNSRCKEFANMGFLSDKTCQRAQVGVFVLLQQQDIGPYKFVGLCVLEIKTPSTLGTVDAVYHQAMEGNKFTECSASTERSKKSIPDSPYRSQVCQHATALVKRVLVVYIVPGPLPQKMVLVTLFDVKRHTLVTLQQIVAEKYLSFFYDAETPAVITSLGDDYSPAYGYM